MNLRAQDHLDTLFVLAGSRILTTREPNPASGPLLSLIRRSTDYCWAVNVSVEDDLAGEVMKLLVDEHPASDLSEPPRHLEAYQHILGGDWSGGPAFEFPEALPSHAAAISITELEPLERSFRGWTEHELPERNPIMAVVEEGNPVSVCFSSRISANIAEAGVETIQQFRGRGLAAIVTAAWAREVRAMGRTPIYSTSWSNGASLAVARKLGLVQCASYWNLTA